MRLRSTTDKALWLGLVVASALLIQPSLISMAQGSQNQTQSQSTNVTIQVAPGGNATGVPNPGLTSLRSRWRSAAGAMPRLPAPNLLAA